MNSGYFTSKRTEKDVLNAIQEIQSRGSGVSYIELANHIGYSRRTVLRAVARLVKDGKLEVIDMKRRPNQYRILDQ